MGKYYSTEFHQYTHAHTCMHTSVYTHQNNQLITTILTHHIIFILCTNLTTQIWTAGMATMQLMDITGAAHRKLPVKNNIPVVCMHKRLNVNTILKIL